MWIFPLVGLKKNWVVGGRGTLSQYLHWFLHIGVFQEEGQRDTPEDFPWWPFQPGRPWSTAKRNCFSLTKIDYILVEFERLPESCQRKGQNSVIGAPVNIPFHELFHIDSFWLDKALTYSNILQVYCILIFSWQQAISLDFHISIVKSNRKIF